MTVCELELLLHRETIHAYRDLISESAGRQRRRLEGDLRHYEDWLPHWRASGDLDEILNQREA